MDSSILEGWAQNPRSKKLTQIDSVWFGSILSFSWVIFGRLFDLNKWVQVSLAGSEYLKNKFRIFEKKKMRNIYIQTSFPFPSPLLYQNFNNLSATANNQSRKTNFKFQKSLIKKCKTNPFWKPMFLVH